MARNWPRAPGGSHVGNLPLSQRQAIGAVILILELPPTYLSRCKPESVPIAPKPASHRKCLFGTCRMPRGFARDGGLLPWDLRRRKIVVDDGWCEGRIVQHRVQLLGIVQ